MSSEYDLEKRTQNFSLEVIKLCRKLQKDIITIPIISQFIRAATSVGANYCEANGASSKKDFRNKIFICKKEAKESLYWVTLLIEAAPLHVNELNNLRDESNQLTRIFNKIGNTLNDKPS